MKKFIILGLVIIFVSLNIYSCKNESATLEGNVLESFRSTPIPNIKVYADGKVTKTNEMGHFQIKGLKKGTVEVTIKDSDKYEEFNDKLVLDAGVNLRDFMLEAKHPLNIPASEIPELTSFAYEIFIGLNKDKPLAIANVETSPAEPALHIVGKEYDASGKATNIEVIQIGITYWVADNYGNWNIIQNPGESVFRINSVFNEKYTSAVNFYKDPNITYKDTEEEVVIDGVKTRKFTATVNEGESGFIDNLEIYVITEGANKGNIKRIISFSPMHSMYPYVEITLSKLNETISIEPPIITK